MLHSTAAMQSPSSFYRLTTGWRITSLLLALSSIQYATAGEDIILDDFESGHFDSWTIAGRAFGDKPASGTLPNQMQVDGFLGNGYASSFHGGDGAIGVMQSKAFVIQRPYLNFLIGGGAFPNQTCLRLRIDGRSVLEAVGPNRNSGGSERLTWNGWDVRAWIGKTATLEIIDDHVGGWGHISVDHIVQSDVFRGPKDITREIPITQAYVMLPVDAAAPLVALQAFHGDTRTHQLDITLGNAKADFFAPVDVRAWIGKTLRWSFRTNEGDEANSRLDAIHFPTSDSPNLPATTDLRPTFHFTAQTGWLNDPNGLVHHNGLWHLYFQHNPVGWNWGNMHWGHATSPDLLQWTEHDDVFRPWVQLKGSAFSGSAVVDVANTSGWGRDGKPPIVAALTDTDAGESMAYSLDGFEWSLYDGNPVVKHPGRDPRILWHEPTQRWVMAVYDETDAKQNIAFYTSADLKHWQFESRIDGFFECPDLIELPHPNQPGASRWVLYGADGQYLMGQFNGRVFTPDTGPKQRLWWGNFYAAQTFSHAPDGRCVQIGWGQGIEFPGQRFNQQMTIPVELSLRDSDRGLHLVAEPVRELHLASRPIADIPNRFSLQPNTPEPIPLPENSVDIAWILEAESPSSVISLKVRGIEMTIDIDSQQVTVGDLKIPLRGPRQRIPMRLLIDRGSIECFLHEGDAVFSRRLHPSAENAELQFLSTGLASLEQLTARAVLTPAPVKASQP